MEFFINDYQEGCLPEIIEKLAKYNFHANCGYGEDEICKKAKKLIKKEIKKPNSDIHFIAGGTLTNKIVITSFLRPFEGVLCADTAHIATHETGAIENGGHKVLTLKSSQGKITPNQIESAVYEHIGGLSVEHTVKPGMVYISQSTEVGTIYTLQEIKEISAVCKKHNLLFFIDGARILYALFSKYCDFTLSDIASLCDLFYIGGTKAGALLGEALVINNSNLKKHFRYILKQNGALMAKGFVMGVQFEGLFENLNYKKYCQGAVEKADRIRSALKSKNIELEFDCSDTQSFVIFKQEQYDKLAKNFNFGGATVKDGMAYARICTSWATNEKKVDHLIKEIESL